MIYKLNNFKKFVIIFIVLMILVTILYINYQKIEKFQSCTNQINDINDKFNEIGLTMNIPDDQHTLLNQSTCSNEGEVLARKHTSLLKLLTIFKEGIYDQFKSFWGGGDSVSPTSQPCSYLNNVNYYEPEDTIKDAGKKDNIAKLTLINTDINNRYGKSNSNSNIYNRTDHSNITKKLFIKSDQWECCNEFNTPIVCPTNITKSNNITSSSTSS